MAPCAQISMPRAAKPTALQLKVKLVVETPVARYATARPVVGVMKLVAAVVHPAGGVNVWVDAVIMTAAMHALFVSIGSGKVNTGFAPTLLTCTTWRT